jgi:alpha-galactosidase
LSRSFYRRAAGTSLLLSFYEEAPVLWHWGADLGELDDDDVAAYAGARTPTVPHSALDEPRVLGVLPASDTGFTGAPAVEALRMPAGDVWTPSFTAWQIEQYDDGVLLTAHDPEAELSVRYELELTEEGVVRTRSTVTNTGSSDLVLVALRSALPVGASATELLDLTGRWTRERVPQRREWGQGTWQRTGRHGRTGHDATLLMAAGTPSFGFRTGTVWATHVAWSGDHVAYAERTAEGESLLGGHELLGPGEVVLGQGASYESPWLMGAWSDRGLDGVSERLHAWTRRHSPRTRSTRPVVVNTWEAVYFDHDLGRLTALADAAADIGVERFVLDDGWFKGRRGDHAGLGDWTVDPAVWPEGLHPLVDHVHARGLEFGLWVEPEMVNVDSDVVRAHPDWVLKGRTRLPLDWRHQQVLNLQHPDAYTYILAALHDLLDEYDIAFLKWDHNRDLIDVGHRGRPAVHGQTLALYRLIDELRAAHPRLEIESCASGGGRVDLGILQRTDRIWPSDTIDALERQHIQRWTSLVVPPEMTGMHVGGPVAHTTGRRHRLGFRAATALLGHFGVEWDISTLSGEERSELAAWIEVHKAVRQLVGSGTVVHGDHPDPSLLVSGVVSVDRTDAVFVIAATGTARTQRPVPVVLPGLDDRKRYVVTSLGPEDRGPVVDLGSSWLAEGPVSLPGAALMQAGISLPVMAPESARVLRLGAQ